MGQERIIVSSKNWQAKREVQYWTRLLNITESEARRLAGTTNKPVDSLSVPKSEPREEVDRPRHTRASSP